MSLVMEIMDFICHSVPDYLINGSQNFAYVHGLNDGTCGF